MKSFEIKFPDVNFVQQHHQNIVRNLSQIVANYTADLCGTDQLELMQNCRVHKKYDSDARVAEMSLEYELTNALRKTTFKFHLQNNILSFERSDKIN